MTIDYDELSGNNIQPSLPFGYDSLLEFGQLPASVALQTRLRRGIVNECCHNACTLETLRSYCG